MADPTEIGKYKVIKKIGEGGMGKVYKAVHPTLNRDIIIKQLMVSRNKVLTKRFLREASLMLDFRHENIVPVYDHFKQRTSYYIVMEFVDGMSLEDLIKGSSLPPLAAILIFTEVCKGLKYAHDHGVIHRDIKPDNVLISKNGEVKLADFGIASSDESEEDLTREGVAMGTPAYMSPEQIADAKNVDSQSDIYSMGVMLYQMVTGKRPFPGNFSSDSIHKITKGIYVKPSQIQPDTPPVLRRLIRKMMHHKKSARFKNLQQVINILSKFTRQYTDQFSINRAIQQYLDGEEGASGKRGMPWGGILLRRMAIGAAAVLAVGFAFFRTGTVHEVFFASSHGKVSVNVELPSDYYKDSELVYAFVEFHPVLDETPEGLSYSFPMKLLSGLRTAGSDGDPEQEEETRSDKVLFSTGKHYLPAGNYTVEAKVETASFLQAITILPRGIQRQDLDTREGRTLSLSFAVPSEKQISVLHRISDRDTGESISRDTVVLIKDGDRWIDWDTYKAKHPEYLKDLLRAGREYHFKYSLPGYFDQEIITFVDEDADSLILNVDLVKKTGSLVISSDTEGLKILIDNKEKDYTGGQTMQYVEFGKTLAAGPRQFELPPGDYILTIKKDAKRMANREFTILPEDELVVEVVYDPEKKEISIL